MVGFVYYIPNMKLPGLESYLNFRFRFRSINAKDLKVFLCDMLNYKLGTDELNDIMKVR